MLVRFSEGNLEITHLKKNFSNFLCYDSETRTYEHPIFHYVDENDKVCNLFPLVKKVSETNEHFEELIKKAVNIVSQSSGLEMNFEIQNWYMEKYNSWMVAVHFPELEISNSKKMKHKLRDVVFLMHFFESAEGVFRIHAYEMLRTTFTRLEIEKGYVFSHVEADVNLRMRIMFCTGNNESSFANAASRQMSKLADFVFLLDYLITYLTWESLEGGPYIKIERVYRKDRLLDEHIFKSTFMESHLKYGTRILITQRNSNSARLSFEVINFKEKEKVENLSEDLLKISNLNFGKIRLCAKIYEMFETFEHKVDSVNCSSVLKTHNLLKNAKRDIHSRQFINTMLAGF